MHHQQLRIPQHRRRPPPALHSLIAVVHVRDVSSYVSPRLPPPFPLPSPPSFPSPSPPIPSPKKEKKNSSTHVFFPSPPPGSSSPATALPLRGSFPLACLSRIAGVKRGARGGAGGGKGDAAPAADGVAAGLLRAEGLMTVIMVDEAGGVGVAGLVGVDIGVCCVWVAGRWSGGVRADANGVGRREEGKREEEEKEETESARARRRLISHLQAAGGGGGVVNPQTRTYAARAHGKSKRRNMNIPPSPPLVSFLQLCLPPRSQVTTAQAKARSRSRSRPRQGKSLPIQPFRTTALG